MIMLNQKESQYTNIEETQDTLIELEEYTSREKNDNVFFSISDIIQKQINDVQYYGQEMYTIQDYTHATYYTYGLILKEEKVEDYYLKVTVDNINNLFLTEQLNREEYNKAKNGEIKEINNKEIPKTDNNTYTLKSFSSEEISRRYIKDYMLKVKYLPNIAFELLEDSYRIKKFQTVDEFKNYILRNENRFQNFVMSKYECAVQENSIEYTVLDINNNYYKIIAYSTLNYKIVLDNYTIDTKEYVEKYNSASEDSKITTCISKFIKLVNAKEYSQIYNYLDTTFKQNNFNTIEKFENYMKSNFFNNNIVTIESKEKIGDIYSCKVVIKSGVGLSAEEKSISIMIQLLEGTDFVMSFSIE